MLGGEQLTPGHSFQGQMPGLGLLPQLGKQSHQSSPASGEVEIVPRRSSFASIGVDAHNAHPIIGAENPFITPDRRVTHDVERLQRKRKVSLVSIGFSLGLNSSIFYFLLPCCNLV